MPLKTRQSFNDIAGIALTQNPFFLKKADTLFCHQVKQIGHSLPSKSCFSQTTFSCRTGSYTLKASRYERYRWLHYVRLMKGVEHWRCFTRWRPLYLIQFDKGLIELVNEQRPESMTAMSTESRMPGNGYIYNIVSLRRYNLPQLLYQAIGPR